MNTFFNIVQECGIYLVKYYYGKSHSDYVAILEQRQRMIGNSFKLPLHMRITVRGKLEQHQAKYLASYFGSNRLNRNYRHISYHFTLTNIA